MKTTTWQIGLQSDGAWVLYDIEKRGGKAVGLDSLGFQWSRGVGCRGAWYTRSTATVGLLAKLLEENGWRLESVKSPAATEAARLPSLDDPMRFCSHCGCPIDCRERSCYCHDASIR